MNPSTTKGKPINFLAVILFFQSAVYATMFFDIPVFRQLAGFFYLTFIPGFVIVRLLRLDKYSTIETVLLSAGFSVAFLMILGLLLNQSLVFLGVSGPLSSLPVGIALGSFVVVGAFFAYLRGRSIDSGKERFFRFIPYALILSCIPILSVVGAISANLYGNNLILLIMIIAISVIFAVCIIFNTLPLSKIYPLIILIFAISLLYHFSLSSNYVHGPDSPFEYAVFRNTQTNAFWNSTNPYPTDFNYGRFSSMLSITILPSVYASILNMNPTWTYLIVFPLIFSLVPLGLYQIWQTYIGKKYAFIASFLFIAEPTFYTEMLSLARQMIGELFFVLLLLVILKKNMKNYERLLCFAIFSFGLIVSHYALAEIFLFLIVAVFAFFLLSSLIWKRSIGSNIFASIVILFAVIMFFWYIYTQSSSVFDSFLKFGQNVVYQLGDFFNPASRGQTVMLALGMKSSPTIWNSISRAFAYMTEAFILIGFVGLIRKRSRTSYDRTFTLLTSLSMVLLAALVLVPGLAGTLNMSRFYHILLFFLAPLCVLGAELIARFVSKRKTEILTSVLLAVVLGSYFVFQTGFVYEVTGSLSYSLPLSGYRFGPRLSTDFAVVTEQEFIGAQWLVQYGDVEHSDVYAGYATSLVECGLNLMRLKALSNVTEPKAGDFVYLGTLNTRYGLVVDLLVGTGGVWNTTDIQNSVLSLSNNIYSSNECEIYTFTSNR